MKSPATRAASARTVREVMQPHVVSVVPEMTVRELVELPPTCCAGWCSSVRIGV
jgi:hypothetical protein